MTGYGEPHAELTTDCSRDVDGVDPFAMENGHGKFILPFRGHRVGK